MKNLMKHMTYSFLVLFVSLNCVAKSHTVQKFKESLHQFRALKATDSKSKLLCAKATLLQAAIQLCDDDHVSIEKKEICRAIIATLLSHSDQTVELTIKSDLQLSAEVVDSSMINQS